MIEPNIFQVLFHVFLIVMCLNFNFFVSNKTLFAWVGFFVLYYVVVKPTLYVLHQGKGTNQKQNIGMYPFYCIL